MMGSTVVGASVGEALRYDGYGQAALSAPASGQTAGSVFSVPTLALVVDTGLEVLRAMMEQDRVALCGPNEKRLPERAAARAGSTPSEVTLGGQRVALRRLRARRAGGEFVLPSLAFAAERDPLDRRSWRAIARGVSTRGCRDVVDPLPAPEVGRAISKSAVSRRFVALSTERLRELTERPIGDLGIRAVLIAGTVFDDHAILIALGVTGPRARPYARPAPTLGCTARRCCASWGTTTRWSTRCSNARSSQVGGALKARVPFRLAHRRRSPRGRAGDRCHRAYQWRTTTVLADTWLAAGSVSSRPTANWDGVQRISTANSSPRPRSPSP